MQLLLMAAQFQVSYQTWKNESEYGSFIYKIITPPALYMSPPKNLQNHYICIIIW